MAKGLKVLVTGATGQQGGATARALLARGHTVRAMTRSADGPAAAALRRHGAEVVTGDFARPGTIAAAAAGVDAAFLMGTPFEAGVDAERTEGIAAVDALKSAKVGHVVYASVASADRQTGIPHFESKHAVERHLAASGLNVTVSGPTFFTENLLSPWFIGGLRDGVLAMALPASRKLQHVTLATLGAFNASLIEGREKVFGQRYDLASDELDGTELAAIVGQAAGRPMRYQEIPVDALLRQNEDAGLMFAWFDKVGYSADIAALRREFPDVRWQTVKDWAESNAWAGVLDPAAAVAAE